MLDQVAVAIDPIAKGHRAAQEPATRTLIALHVGWTKGSDPAVEELVARAVAATAPAARRSLYRQIQRGLNARSPFMPLIQPTQAFVSTTDLAGAVFSGAYDLDVTHVSPA